MKKIYETIAPTERLEHVGKLLWGDSWCTAMDRALDVRADTCRRWARHPRYAITADHWAWEKLREIAHKRAQDVQEAIEAIE